VRVELERFRSACGVSVWTFVVSHPCNADYETTTEADAGSQPTIETETQQDDSRGSGFKWERKLSTMNRTSLRELLEEK